MTRTKFATSCSRQLCMTSREFGAHPRISSPRVTGYFEIMLGRGLA
jgi:hypothetical protein